MRYGLYYELLWKDIAPIDEKDDLPEDYEMRQYLYAKCRNGNDDCGFLTVYFATRNEMDRRGKDYDELGG